MELLEDESNLLSSISRKFYRLPSHLRRYLSFCSFFPIGHIFKREILITMWMARGYVQINGNVKEDIASHYFEDLLELSMFQLGLKVQSIYVLPLIIHLVVKHVF